jgi:hypothetical protein
MNPAGSLGGALVADVDVMAQLRSLLPSRPMTWSEAHSIAERQAALLLDLLFIAEPPVPQFVISSLPGIVVDRRADWPTSGMAVRSRSHWRIVLKADEPRQRQRFSLAHEFKHVLDDPVIDRTQAHLKPHRQKQRAERLCNYFAACLLMPRPWVKHDWCGGIQATRSLARRYYVSEEAMTTRLAELGLTAYGVATTPAPHLGRHIGGL